MWGHKLKSKIVSTKVHQMISPSTVLKQVQKTQATYNIMRRYITCKKIKKTMSAYFHPVATPREQEQVISQKKKTSEE